MEVKVSFISEGSQIVGAGPPISANNAFYDRIGLFPIVFAQSVGGRAPVRKL